jgi:hypothetical protein
MTCMLCCTSNKTQNVNREDMCSYMPWKMRQQQPRVDVHRPSGFMASHPHIDSISTRLVRPRHNYKRRCCSQSQLTVVSFTVSPKRLVESESSAMSRLEGGKGNKNITQCACKKQGVSPSVTHRGAKSDRMYCHTVGRRKRIRRRRRLFILEQIGLEQKKCVEHKKMHVLKH